MKINVSPNYFHCSDFRSWAIGIALLSAKATYAEKNEVHVVFWGVSLTKSAVSF